MKPFVTGRRPFCHESGQMTNSPKKVETCHASPIQNHHEDTRSNRCKPAFSNLGFGVRRGSVKCLERLGHFLNARIDRTIGRKSAPTHGTKDSRTKGRGASLRAVPLIVLVKRGANGSQFDTRASKFEILVKALVKEWLHVILEHLGLFTIREWKGTNFMITPKVMVNRTRGFDVKTTTNEVPSLTQVLFGTAHFEVIDIDNKKEL